MRKKYVITVVILILVAAAGLYWYFGIRDNIKIVSLTAPSELGVRDVGTLLITFQNNAPVPVNVSLDVKNNIVHGNGTAANYINPQSKYGQLILPPGKHTEEIFLGYMVPGKYDVMVKVYQKGILIYQSSFNVSVSTPNRPDLSVQLSYRKETKDGNDVYNIYGYIIENSILSMNGYDVPVQITIIDDLTGQTILNNTEIYYVHQGIINTLSRWNNRPMAIIELTHNKPSNETYLPVEYVVKGKHGDRYRVNVTASWEDPWYERRYGQWLEQEGRVYETNGYWWDKDGTHYEPPQFDRIISGSDELLIPPD